MVSSHDFVDDKRNKNIKIYINGKFYKRKDAKISVFDSSTMLGDGIWDSLRYHNDNFIFLEEHLDRLYKDAKLIDLKIHLTRKKLSEALIKTIQINKMKTDVHLRMNNIKTPKAVRVLHSEDSERAIKELDSKFPVVLKLSSGSQTGVGVSHENMKV